MSNHQKSIVARWFEEVWNQDRNETIDEVMLPNSVIHDGDADIRGPEGFKLFKAALHDQFDDIRVKTHHIVTEGDVTVVRWTSTMRSKQNGQQLQTTGMSLIRFHDGRVAEAWQNWDRFGLMDQIQKSAAATAG